MSDPILKVEDVSKRFGALLASDHVNLDLKPGEIHALIGPNGAGKSTLIKQIVGELKHDEGTIQFNGKIIDAMDAVTRARNGLARTFQVSSLAQEISALHNVMLAVQAVSGSVYHFFKPVLKDTELVDTAMQQLERVGLHERAHMRTADLSHGQRRQLEMAIALALKPKVFLLDEPMAGMGPDGSRNLTEFLSGLRSEAPILLVEHDMDAVFALADRISVLVYGKVIATGTVDEIRNSAEVQRAYLGDEEA